MTPAFDLGPREGENRPPTPRGPAAGVESRLERCQSG